MTGKATAVAPSNIALIKYWGIRESEPLLPYNPSFSMTLRDCVTRTTVEGLAEAADDEVLLRNPAGELTVAPENFAAGVVRHLDRLRSWAGVESSFRVATQNSFPMGAGLASSASGFAALALAVTAALGREVTSQEASLLARESGSGSAARSVFGGYVEWPGPGDREGAAAQLFAADHWDLRDVIAILDSSEKRVSSRQGHRLATTSPYYAARLEQLPARLERVRGAVAERDFLRLAPLVEEEAIDLHLIAMSSRPPIFYWQPATLTVLAKVRELRDGGLEVCATMDAGANVHLICTASAEDAVVIELAGLNQVEQVIRDRIGSGPEIVDDPLF